MNKSLIYLATPYTHADLSVQLERFNQVNKLAAVLMGAGLHVYSPISHTHPIAVEGNLPTTWQYWEQYLRAILPHCAVLAVFMQDGWEQSSGVTGEIKIATECNIPVVYIPSPILPGHEQYFIDIVRAGIKTERPKTIANAFGDFLDTWKRLSAC